MIDGSHPANYDVVIVGARVAGSSLALLLGRLGHQVLLIDRARFPSDTLSTHFIGPAAVPLLARLGVLADVEAVGFRRITRCRTVVEDCIFEGPHAANGGYALAPRRDALDAILIEHARRQESVEFCEQTRADGLLWDAGRVVGAIAVTPDGERRGVRASVVVGADGKYSKLARWVEAAHYHEVPALRPAYYGYYRGLAPLPEPAIEMYFVNSRIGFVFPMQPELDCLALEVQPEDADDFKADRRAAFEKCFCALPTMASRFAGAQLDGKIFGTLGIANYFCQPYGPGWALTGDAGYLKDPITGMGIGDALNQAIWLAEALDAVFSGADWDATLSEFHRRRDETLLPAFQATVQMAQMRSAPPEAVAWMRAALSNPSFGRILASVLCTALPDLMPAPMQPRLRQVAAAFGASPAAGVLTE